jgi:hypothetical protein
MEIEGFTRFKNDSSLPEKSKPINRKDCKEFTQKTQRIENHDLACEHFADSLCASLLKRTL